MIFSNIRGIRAKVVQYYRRGLDADNRGWLKRNALAPYPNWLRAECDYGFELPLRKGRGFVRADPEQECDDYAEVCHNQAN